ncbi:trypsin-like peptidase domain-containing protein [Microcoleus sp. EPA2]|uniref:trypsin-like peptidase domain-containing protein n=1 Tax=Microcoleus sp. EPA2 TaxID=2841654 RepID=UPI00312BB440
MMGVVISPLMGTTMPRSEIENIAREVTVLIKTPDPLKHGKFLKSGTGVIVGKKTKEANTYYILTAKHIATSSKKYKIVTPDGIERDITNAEVIEMNSTDLALLTLRTTQNYKIPSWGDSDKLTAKDTIYIYGWPSSKSLPHFTAGKFVDNRLLLSNEGYGLVYRDAQVENGMSGAPIFDYNGKLVGIHGIERGGFGVERLSLYQRGVSINSFLNDMLLLGLTAPSVTYLELCNQQNSKKEVQFVFAKNSGNNGWVTRGWFSIKPDSCRTVAIGEEYQGIVYFYAEDSDGNWGKGQQYFCVNNQAFSMINSDTVTCNGSNQRRVNMLEIKVSPGKPTTQNLTG